MVSAWIHNENDQQDPRFPHQSSETISLEQLSKLGVLYYHIDCSTNHHDNYMDQIERLCQERNYKNRHVITVSRKTLPDYEKKLSIFLTEHLHEDEEIRYILESSGYLYVRDAQGRWVRICLEQSDLIILPPGIYHRFVPDLNNYIEAMRLFKDDPGWTPLNRNENGDQSESRIVYVNQYFS